MIVSPHQGSIKLSCGSIDNGSANYNRPSNAVSAACNGSGSKGMLRPSSVKAITTNSTLSDYMNTKFQDRHSGRDCRNPGPMDGFTLAVHGTGCPLPGGHDELADNQQSRTNCRSL